MSNQAIDTVSNPPPAVLETAPAQEEETLTESAVVTEVAIDGGPLLKTELYGTEKEKRLASFVANAEATRKTAGAEGTFLRFILSLGFKRTQNMKIEGVVKGLLGDGQQVRYLI
jgi:hypothetical protein